MSHGSLPARVRIVEVGPRDGLQNQTTVLPTATKLAWIERLAGAGLREIEVTSFVRPDRIPPLADAAEVAAGLTPRDGVTWSALVPNARGLEGALAAGIRDIALFTAASETFCRKNINASIAESVERFRVLLEAAPRDAEGRRDLRVRAYLSTCFGCPYEGAIPAEAVVEVCRQLLALEIDELAISDTIGVATPADIHRVIDAVEALPGLDLGSQVALHLHDTRGTALANVCAGLERGISIFDAAAGGLGGCPYAPGASGNLATEDLVYLLDGLGVESGVDLESLIDAGLWFEQELGSRLPGRVIGAARAGR
ncbi:MAG: hydroxymethylglutaryl-CoA lyase [Planctomycetota bacterium]